MFRCNYLNLLLGSHLAKTNCAKPETLAVITKNMKTLITTLLILISITTFLFADVWGYYYKQSGVAYIEDKIIKNDTIYFYQFQNSRSPKTIFTDKHGNYEVEVEVSGYCMSGGKKCQDLDPDECYYFWSKRINSDSLTFSYKDRTFKIRNKYLQILKSQRNGTLKSETRFVTNINFR